ncbi:protein quiver-like [Dreissena polymorpha]|uniref:protein quiver-like n=1 Tax=Dreissena polymorpha TaxID=45954 RepID=UPI0022654360|nr:protein quiver-like [Dreissena polymorpha]
MNMGYTVSVVVMLSFLYAESATALQCYDCDSASNSKCADQFVASAFAAVNGCAQCVKQKGVANGVTVVIRRCGATVDGNNECVKRPAFDSEGTYCLCNTDLCNGAEVGRSLNSAIVILFLATFLRFL